MSTTTVNRARKSAPVKGEVSVAKPLSGAEARALILSTMDTIGSPLAVITEFDTKVAELDANLIRWFGVAVKAKASGIAAREFGTLTGTDKNWLGRLVAASSLHVAHKAKGLTLTAREAVKVANVQSAATIDGYVKAVRKGSDPLSTKAGTVKPSKGVKRAATVKAKGLPATEFGTVLGWIDANILDATSDVQSIVMAHALSIVATLEAEGVTPADLAGAEAEAEAEAV